VNLYLHGILFINCTYLLFFFEVACVLFFDNIAKFIATFLMAISSLKMKSISPDIVHMQGRFNCLAEPFFLFYYFIILKRFW